MLWMTRITAMVEQAHAIYAHADQQAHVMQVPGCNTFAVITRPTLQMHGAYACQHRNRHA